MGYHCVSCYIDETKHNPKVRWDEHKNLNKNLKALKHPQSNINRYFTQAVTLNSPKNANTREKT